jgi:hypothetical protein
MANEGSVAYAIICTKFTGKKRKRLIRLAPRGGFIFMMKRPGISADW